MSEETEGYDLLFLRLKTGDQRAYEEIYEKFSKLLFQAAYNKVRDQEVAEDMVQNIFISIWEKREELMVKDAKYYLLGCLKYAVINYIRAQVMENKYLEFSKSKAGGEEEIFSLIEVNDLSAIIEKGISSLPDKTQEIFRLSRFGHQSTKNISLDLKISEKTVEYHITRSIKFIKAYLKHYYLFLSLFFFLLISLLGS
jgi:RNA polymerase sigma-70 factor (ECF subfamily)